MYLFYLYNKQVKVMATIDKIKNRLIDRILAVQNEKFLAAIEEIFVATQKEEDILLYPEQKEMLLLSDLDIENGNIVSETELDKLDSEWND